MYPIEFQHIQTLVRFIVEQVVGRFLSTFKILSDTKTVYYSEFLDYVTPIIVERIVHSWADVHSCHHAEHVIEEMYNAARTELVQLLNLHGGTVEFEPSDVQPLTDQRLGQTEAWDLWIAHLWETHFQVGWYINGEFLAEDLDDFLADYDQIRYVTKHDATIEYHRIDHHHSWTYTSFNHDRFMNLLGTRI